MRRAERERMFQKFNQESGVSTEEYYYAIARVKRIKKFYVHLIVFILVNAYLIFDECFDAESFVSLFKLHTYSTMFFWGIGLVAHGLSVFGKDIFFGDNWEERKIKEFMEKDKNQINY